MLNPNELRIGNWIDTPTGVRQVYEVSESFLNGFEGNLKSCDPITLTPEILRSCGFREKAAILTKENAAGEFSLSYFDEKQYKIWKDNRYMGILPLRYLHQLQNLYFAFTATELHVNMYSLVATR